MSMCKLGKSAKFIFRLDDLAPGLHEENFDRVMYYLLNNNICPLLGVVPDNCDPKLKIQAPSEDFWDKIRKMAEDGQVDIAQHGYQHILYESNQGILNKKYFLSPLTEFAGLPYKQQFAMIQKGKQLLYERGLLTNIWMAPNHSFDRITLTALQDLDFTRISDGVGLYPYYRQNLLFVPQQLGRVRIVPPFGIWTVCLHVNNMTSHEIERIAGILPFLTVISFPTMTRNMPVKINQYANSIFQPVYAVLRALKVK